MKNLAISPAEILLPTGVDMQKWACIACDQFTSEIDYWKDLEKFVGEEKSTLKLVLPEIYLDGTEEEKIKNINANIKNYLANGVFNKLDKGFILTVRSTPYVQKRIGLMANIDLEKYDYSQKSSALVRATEGTIKERIPPRLKIRENADVEFPHVMVLFDDEKLEITEQLYADRNKYKKLYDFDLNMKGGHIEGYFIDDVDVVLNKFYALLDEKRLIEKYGSVDKFLFAVGDGNHSLATAKTYWEKVKNTLTEQEQENHPARYALVELVNIYDSGIYFEPIFRYVYGVDKKDFIDKLSKANIKGFKLIDGEKELVFDKDALPKAISNIDGFIKEYISANGGNVDYVHGEENLNKLVTARDDAVGILFDKLDKSSLFKYVSQFGALPRKTFSMGEGVEKRYYLEGRKIVK